MATLQIAFIVLKICGVINWSWLVVLIPIILFVVINIAAHLFLWGRRDTQSVEQSKHRGIKLYNKTNKMKKECVVYCESDYITNLLDEGMVKVTACLVGKIVRVSNRRLLGIIRLKDKYVYNIKMCNLKRTVETIKGPIEEPLTEARLTFESEKRIGVERYGLERRLINKCNEYKKRNGKSW